MTYSISGGSKSGLATPVLGPLVFFRGPTPSPSIPGPTPPTSSPEDDEGQEAAEWKGEQGQREEEEAEGREEIEECKLVIISCCPWYLLERICEQHSERTLGTSNFENV